MESNFNSIYICQVHLRASVHTRAWFAQHVLFAQPHRFMEYLLECPAPEVRMVFSKLIVLVAHCARNDPPLHLGWGPLKHHPGKCSKLFLELNCYKVAITSTYHNVYIVWRIWNRGVLMEVVSEYPLEGSVENSVMIQDFCSYMICSNTVSFYRIGSKWWRLHLEWPAADGGADAAQ